MRSRRSTHAILSLPHKYRVPLRRKRSLGYARDDETRERAISHSLSFHHVEGCPFGADLSSAFGAPLLQGATQQSCKNAEPSQGLLHHIVISSEKSFSFVRGSRFPHICRASLCFSHLSFIPPVPYPPLRGTFPSRGRLTIREYRHLKCGEAATRALSPSYQSTHSSFLPPSFGRRCPEGAEVGSRCGFFTRVDANPASLRSPAPSRGRGENDS